ncbi:chaplin [Streptomyces sp. NPDC058308]|uniref:chaplin n=1 Tax=Streptomyces sp. NPDC058308 TaxID=3346440 RepID=UPI0036EEA8F8
MNSIAKKTALAVVAAGLAAGASAGVASATSDAQANGAATKSPGVGSGNLVQAPVHVPVNVTGNSVNVVGVLNPAFANATVNR